MPGARIREQGEERGDGGPDIGRWVGWGGGGDGLLKGLGRPEPVEESLYAICVLGKVRV